MEISRRGPVVLAALIVLATNQPFWAGDTKTIDTKTLDKAVHAALRDAINHGAELFNVRGDHNACYRVFQATLITVKPLLVHRPELQRVVEQGLADAESHPRVVDRAFALRKVIDEVRDTVVPRAGVLITDKKRSLWDRLGGEANVAKVVEEFFATAAADPKVNITRDGKIQYDDKRLAAFKKNVIAFISAAAGGPFKYGGKSMKDAHKGMAVTDAEFNATAEHLVKALRKYQARQADIDELVKALEDLRKDIVETPTGKDASKDAGRAKKAASIEPGPNEGLVSGKVTLNGRPAPTGYLTLLTADGRKFSTFIHIDGDYSFRLPLPVGAYRVYIEEGLKGDPLTDKNQVRVPARFRSAETSALRFEVRNPRNVFDIDLRD